MNMHLSISAPTHQLARYSAYNDNNGAGSAIEEGVAAELPPLEWKFAIGQCVTGVSDAMPSRVIARCKVEGESPHELYKVRPYTKSGPWRDKTVSGDRLRAIQPDDADCKDCLLCAAGFCSCGMNLAAAA